MISRGEDVEAQALKNRGVVDLGHRPSPRPGSKDDPGLSQRAAGGWRAPVHRA